MTIKYVNPSEEDQALIYLTACDKIAVCSASPVSYNDAMVTYMLANTTLTSGSSGGDFTLANDTSGRKVTIAAKSGITITNSGSANFVALLKSSGSELRAFTSCTMQFLTAGGTVDIPAFKANVQDPT